MINTMEELARLRKQNAELQDRIVDLTLELAKAERAKTFFRDDALRFRYLLELTSGIAPPLAEFEP